MPSTVADLCQAREMTIPQLADESGLDESRTAAICEGRWTPSPAERAKIAAVFELATDRIAWGHKTPIQHLYGHGPT